MNKKLIALAGLLAVSGFMTSCSKKKCATKNEQRRDAHKKKHRTIERRDLFRK